MKSFENYCGERIQVHADTLNHIKEIHKEITLKMIKDTLKDPDEIRWSSKKNDGQLYYLFKRKNRYICVVVKICDDGNFISTALTTSKPKIGTIFYRKGER